MVTKTANLASVVCINLVAVILAAPMACAKQLVNQIDATPIASSANLPIMLGLGVPSPASAKLVQPAETQIQIRYSLSSNANDAGSIDGAQPKESLIIDSETHALTLAARHGLTERWQLAGELTYLQHRAGFLDGVISSWHDLFDLPQGDRKIQEEDQILIEYKNGQTVNRVSRSQKGISDIKLGASYQLLDRSDDFQSGLRQASIAFQINLPSGDQAKLTGSDKIDWSLGVNTSGQMSNRLAWHANLGVLNIGDSSAFAIKTADEAMFSSLGLHWQLASAWRLSGQWDVRQALFVSKIPELNQSANLLSFALEYASRANDDKQGVVWQAYFSEDVSVNRAPDFNFGVGASWDF